MHIKIISVVLFVFMLSDAALSEVSFQEELQSDRPDFTEGAYVVEASHMQLEAGITYSNRKFGEEGLILPEALLRMGVIAGLELRLFWEGYDLGTDEGVSSASIGFKKSIIKESDTVPRLSFIAEVGCPDSSDIDDATEGGAKLLWEKELLGGGLAGNFNLFHREDRVSSYLEGSVSVSISRPVIDDLDLYLEYYSIIPFESHNHHESYLNGGPVVLLSENFQADIRVGAGLNSSSDNYFIGSGIVFRR